MDDSHVFTQDGNNLLCIINTYSMITYALDVFSEIHLETRIIAFINNQ